MLPANWTDFKALRSLLIDCLPVSGEGCYQGQPSDAAFAAANVPGRAVFGSESQLQSLRQIITFKEGTSMRSVSILNCGMQVGNVGGMIPLLC